jgi:O-antigen/teichoic acid export membrane protein
VFPKFVKAADILRAFAPLLMLMYFNLFLSTAVLAVGKAHRLAISKIVAVALVIWLAFFLVPFCEDRFGNGGLGVMYAMLAGELLMVVVSWALVKEAIDGRLVVDMLRSLVAGVATLLLFRFLPALTPFLGIPLCILVFGAVSWMVGSIRRSDVELLVASLRKPKTAS